MAQATDDGFYTPKNPPKVIAGGGLLSNPGFKVVDTPTGDLPGGGRPVPNPDTGAGAGTGTAQSQTDYAAMIADALRAQQQAEAARLQASIEQGVNTLNAQRPELEKQYQDAAQQAYIQNMMAKKNLPQTMAAQGLGGGLHESSLIDMENTYGNNLSTLRSGYDSSIGALDRDVANLRATGDISLAQNAGTYAAKIAEALQQAQAAQLSAQGSYSSNGGSGLTYNQALDAYNNGVRTSAVMNVLRSSYGDDWDGNITPKAATSNIATNAYVKNATSIYDPTKSPIALLRYLDSNGLSGAEVEQAAAYLGIPSGIVKAWVSGYDDNHYAVQTILNSQGYKTS